MLDCSESLPEELKKHGAPAVVVTSLVTINFFLLTIPGIIDIGVQFNQCSLRCSSI